MENPLVDLSTDDCNPKEILVSQDQLIKFDLDSNNESEVNVPQTKQNDSKDESTPANQNLFELDQEDQAKSADHSEVEQNSESLPSPNECIADKCEHQKLLEPLHLQLDTLLTEKEELTKTVNELKSDLNECEQLIANKEAKLQELQSSEQTIAKLKALAIKLKRELAESKEIDSKTKEELKILSKEHEKVQSAHHLLIKNFQNLQNEHDRLQDEFENAKKSLKLFENDLASNVNELTNKKGQVETIRLENESLLRKMTKLETKLDVEQTKAKELDSKIIVLRNQLDESKRKNAKLSEIEKLHQELTERLSAKDITESELQRQNEELVRKVELLSAKEAQIVELEKKVNDLTIDLKQVKSERDQLLGKQNATEENASHLIEQSDRLKQELLQLQEISVDYKTQLIDLETKLKSELSSKNELLNLAEEELKRKETEFAAYKVKVNKVLAEKRNTIEQNSYEQQLLHTQAKVDELSSHIRSLELSLQNEKDKLDASERDVMRLRQEIDLLQDCKQEANELRDQLDRIKSNQRDSQNQMQSEKQSLEENVFRLQSELDQNRTSTAAMIEELKKQIDSLKEQNQLLQSTSTTRSTLNQSTTLPNDLIESKSNLQSDSQFLNFSQESDVALEADDLEPELSGGKSKRLSVSSLNSNFVNPLQEILYEKDKVTNENGDQMKHLKELFEESESNNSLLTEQNRVLKEEIRRLQRSIDRTEIAENLEYLKNVLIKFVSIENNTSNASDKKHLVPVLKTILKLSKEEESKLHNFASFLSNLNERNTNTSSSTNQPGNWSSYIWNGFS